MKMTNMVFRQYLQQKVLDHSGLSVRESYLLTTLCEGLEGQNQKNDVEIFDLLICLIFLADKTPAKCIVDLLTLVTYEHSFDVLERDTVQRSAEFLRDHFKMISLRNCFYSFYPKEEK